MTTIYPAMTDHEENIKSYCGYCKKDFSSEIYICPNCGSNLINYNNEKPGEKLVRDNKWKRHNTKFKLVDREGNGKKR